MDGEWDNVYIQEKGKRKHKPINYGCPSPTSFHVKMLRPSVILGLNPKYFQKLELVKTEIFHVWCPLIN